jgi:hypothetical protein
MKLLGKDKPVRHSAQVTATAQTRLIHINALVTLDTSRILML